MIPSVLNMAHMREDHSHTHFRVAAERRKAAQLSEFNDPKRLEYEHQLGAAGGWALYEG